MLAKLSANNFTAAGEPLNVSFINQHNKYRVILTIKGRHAGGLREGYNAIR